MERKFSGFQSPNYTQVPDEVFDELLSKLNLSELKVLLYIIRRTFGFKRSSDNISMAQICNGIKTRGGKVLDKGTGLGKASVARAIKSLEEKNIIIAFRRKSKEKGFLPTTYSLNVIHTPLSQKETSLVSKVNTQYTVLQDTDNNVNVDLKHLKKPEYEVKSLITKMEEELQDHHSQVFYKKIAEQVSSELIYRALSQIKDMNHRGEIKKSKAALFNGLIKKMAREIRV